MGVPPAGRSTDDSEPGGLTYGAVILAERDTAVTGIQDVLHGIRFSGWIAPPRDGWVVVLGDPGDGVVADEHRGIIEVGGLLAERSDRPMLAVRVREDHQLGIVVWRAGDELGRYCSDPSREPKVGDADDILAQPVGAEIADSLAELWNRTDAAKELTELLEEELDPDSVYESERLLSLLRLLGMPAWVVAAGALPKDIPTGPKARELIRLRVGATGTAGGILGRTRHPMRRRRHPPPVIADPPRGGGGFEEWML
jgi:hypothetical protein